MNNTVSEIILDIKKDLRANMNGVASAAMRSTADYRVNFGVELPRLQMIAKDYGKRHDLAQALWKESVRECKILATLIQPVELFDEEFADLWIESTHTAEIAQIASLNLFQHMKCATIKAFQWIASENEIKQVAGLCIISHLIRGTEFSERSLNELNDQLIALLEAQETPLSVRKLANNISIQINDDSDK